MGGFEGYFCFLCDLCGEKKHGTRRKLLELTKRAKEASYGALLIPSPPAGEGWDEGDIWPPSPKSLPSRER